jgi:hypothetical protein
LKYIGILQKRQISTMLCMFVFTGNTKIPLEYVV